LGLAAQKRLRAGDAQGALPMLRRAHELAPENVEVLNDFGLCLIGLDRPREALAAFQAALARRPDSARLHFGRALAFEKLGELDRERQELERVVDLEPRHHKALSLLAMLAIDRNDVMAARDYAGRAHALSPKEAPASLALAAADIAVGDFASAGKTLDALLADPALDADNRASAQTLRGDALDGLGRCDEAFVCYGAAAETLKARYLRIYSRGRREGLRAQAERLAQDMRRLPRLAESPARSGRDEPIHVFVLGFMRSGTTLIGQILAGHPDCEMMHERDCLCEAAREFLAPAGGLEKFLSAPAEALERHRRTYWDLARQSGARTDAPMFVDKSPLAALALPLIARLFPQAKIVFAMRDPRDVVFSCFRRRFAMNELRYQMLSLEGIAGCYAATMDMAQACREKLPLSFRDVRHERLVDDLADEAAGLCDFLGASFQPSMLDFAERAAARNIDAPEAGMLARGLSRESVGAWRRYAARLAPVMPALEAWRVRFGYPED
jgi:Flp pilus assembly protein TadD